MTDAETTGGRAIWVPRAHALSLMASAQTTEAMTGLLHEMAHELEAGRLTGGTVEGSDCGGVYLYAVAASDEGVT